MTGFARGNLTTETGHRHGAAISVALVLGLAGWTLGHFSSLCCAQTPSPQIVENPNVTFRAARPGRSNEPMSDEIWISAEETLPARSDALPTTQDRSTPQTSGVDPAPQANTGSMRASPGAAAKVSYLATTIERLRAARSLESPAERPELSDTPSQEAAASPTLSALRERLEPARSDPEESQKDEMLAPLVSEGDDALFHTTSAPVKPASSLFRPGPESRTNDALPASPQQRLSQLQVPEGPTAEPEAQVRLVTDKLLSKAQAENTISESRIPSAGRSNNPSLRGEDFAVQANTRNPAVQPPFSHPPRPTPSGTPRAGTIQARDARYVILRVKLAELDHEASRTAGLLDFSRRPPLLRSLLEAEPGKGPILLDSTDSEAIESQVQWLKQRGVLRIRSEPTLVTASGRPAKFTTDAGAPMSSTGPGKPISAAASGLDADVTILPVVIRDDQIQLEVACRTIAASPGASVAESAPSATWIGTANVQMRPGQTLAIPGSGQDRSQSDDPRPSLAGLLGIGKSDEKQTGLVLFVTPELIQFGGPNQAASLAGQNRPMSPGTGEVSKAEEAMSVLTSPITKLWDLAKRRTDDASSTRTR